MSLIVPRIVAGAMGIVLIWLGLLLTYLCIEEPPPWPVPLFIGTFIAVCFGAGSLFVIAAWSMRE